jgi:hypothetical protein
VNSLLGFSGDLFEFVLIEDGSTLEFRTQDERRTWVNGNEACCAGAAPAFILPDGRQKSGIRPSFDVPGLI